MGIEVGIHLPEPQPEQLGANLLRRTAPQGTDHDHLPEPHPEQLGAKILKMVSDKPDPLGEVTLKIIYDKPKGKTNGD